MYYLIIDIIDNIVIAFAIDKINFSFKPIQQFYPPNL